MKYLDFRQTFEVVTNTKQKRGFAYASKQRNKGIELAKGDWLYYLDDDNLLHPKLYEKVQAHGKKADLIIFNQFAHDRARRIKNFDLDKNRPGYIDTAQIVVSNKYKHIKWRDERQYMEEYDYITDLVNGGIEGYINFCTPSDEIINFLEENSIDYK